MLMPPFLSHYFDFSVKFNLQIRFCSWLSQYISEIAQPELLITTEVQM